VATESFHCRGQARRLVGARTPRIKGGDVAPIFVCVLQISTLRTMGLLCQQLLSKSLNPSQLERTSFLGRTTGEKSLLMNSPLLSSPRPRPRRVRDVLGLSLSFLRIIFPPYSRVAHWVCLLIFLVFISSAVSVTRLTSQSTMPPLYFQSQSGCPPALNSSVTES
jgi:hypothetical protein